MPMYLFFSTTLQHCSAALCATQNPKPAYASIFSLHISNNYWVHFSLVKEVMLVHNIWTSLYFCLVLIYDSGLLNTEHKQLQQHESYVLAENLFSESFHTA